MELKRWREFYPWVSPFQIVEINFYVGSSLKKLIFPTQRALAAKAAAAAAVYPCTDGVPHAPVQITLTHTLGVRDAFEIKFITLSKSRSAIYEAGEWGWRGRNDLEVCQRSKCCVGW